MLYINCRDLGDQFLVLSVSKTLPVVYNEATTFLESTDSAVYGTIVENLALGKTVYIDKTGGTPRLIDITVDGSNSLINYKHKMIYKLQNIASTRLSKINLFSFFDYSYYNTKFMQKGYFFCGENTEDEYIKILEKNDPEEISMLEKYLNATTKIQEHRRIADEVNTATESILSARNKTEVDVYYDNAAKEIRK